jgi:small subunit ribosomal protein S8
MTTNDPISDFLTRIRNGGNAGAATIRVPHSKMKARLADILKNEGFIRDVAQEGEGITLTLVITLKYDGRKAFAIKGLRRISKPGLRRYVGAGDVPRVLNGLGISILSTSKGVMSDKDARKNRAGGEILCQVW